MLTLHTDAPLAMQLDQFTPWHGQRTQARQSNAANAPAINPICAVPTQFQGNVLFDNTVTTQNNILTNSYDSHTLLAVHDQTLEDIFYFIFLPELEAFSMDKTFHSLAVLYL